MPKNLLIVAFTVLLDLIGFGMIIPLSPYIAKEFDATSLQIGLLMSIYSVMQFFFSPIWGNISDRIGRRPVLLICLVGSSISHIAFAFSPSLVFLFLARGAAGLFGSTMSVASAYIADQTDENSRSKNMGLIGAAFGLGFVVGPIIAGILSYWGKNLGFEGAFLIGFPALGASLINIFNFLFAYFKLPESLVIDKNSSKDRKSFSKIFEFNLKSLAGKILIVSLIFSIGMGQMESTLALLVKEVFSWSVINTSFAFGYVGLILAFSNGVLHRKLIPIMGERLVLSVGLGLTAVGMFLISISDSIYFLCVAVSLLAIGSGLVHPSILGILSLSFPQDKQGFIMGVYQSYASIGRVLGPIAGGYLFDALGYKSPYQTSAVYMLFALVIVLYIFKKIPTKGLS